MRRSDVDDGMSEGFWVVPNSVDSYGYLSGITGFNPWSVVLIDYTDDSKTLIGDS